MPVKGGATADYVAHYMRKVGGRTSRAQSIKTKEQAVAMALAEARKKGKR